MTVALADFTNLSRLSITLWNIAGMYLEIDPNCILFLIIIIIIIIIIL
jgi:hypothetical protein